MRSTARDTGPTAEVVATLFHRDNGRCAVDGEPIAGTRGWDWSVHHRSGRKRGGTTRAWVNLPGNLLLVCGNGTVGCHFRIESNGLWARENGFRVREGVLRPVDVPVAHAVHGLVLLDDAGDWKAWGPDDGTWTEAP
jgi:hypothetical protein